MRKNKVFWLRMVGLSALYDQQLQPGARLQSFAKLHVADLVQVPAQKDLRLSAAARRQ